MCKKEVCSPEHFYDHFQVLEKEDMPLEPEERLRAMEGPLLSWYRARARILPWREDPEPYRVWVSEIMLQQTRVEAVKPYFKRFMDAFPTIRSLAQAEDDYLMKMWEGLGYYNRARNLKAAACRVCEEYGGSLPASYEELLKLPGIGSYTAGAIASIAFQIPMPAVDGNVLRVISRVLADRRDIRSASVKTDIEGQLRQIMPKDKASSYNQGLIEIGALVCIPGGEPKCSECPLASLCLTGKGGLWREIPFKSPPKARKVEEKTVLLLECEGRYAIRKRPSRGLLASLYEFPSLEGFKGEEEVLQGLKLFKEDVEQTEVLPEAKHIFSHVEWHMRGLRLVLKREHPLLEGCFLASPQELFETYALPNAFSAYLKCVRQGEAGANKEAGI